MRRNLPYTGLMGLASAVQSQSPPYNPSSIFLLPNSNIAYIFRPSTHSANQAQLFSFDYEKGFDSPATSFTTVSESLPFLDEEKRLAYTPTISVDGNITVVAGDCSQGADGLQTWVFRPEGKESDGSGSWSQMDTVAQDLGSKESMTGANFLATATLFSSYANASGGDATVYSFGGMCPESISTVDTWQTDAEYSDLMLTLSKTNSGAGSTNYDISALQNRGPPIAQAGATITGLRIAYSSGSDNGAQVLQQDFVLLAGHTQAAFINTSDVAVFSLPQASWSFMPVRQPSSTKTDLALRKRQGMQITPRSGHTAVLSETGDSIIVFGGWVGDVSTPASPQLAVLDMGQGGDWSWRIPEQSGSSLATDTGLYGHGATILPGNVMMVVGGYSTGRSSSNFFRRSTQTASDQVLFYNVTSSSWVDIYSPPIEDQSSSGPLSQTSAKVGLGTGLGFGAALLISVVVFYFLYSKRLKRKREERQRTLLVHSSDSSYAQMDDQPFLNDGGFDGRGGDEAAVGRFWPMGGAAGSYPNPPEMQHTTGMFVSVPSPTRGLRRGGGKSYQYHAAPRFDDKRVSRTGAGIHPIAEQANEDEDGEEERRSASDELTDAERKLKDLERVLMSEDDPFTDEQPNPLGSHPVSPEAPTQATVMRVPTGASRPSYRTIPRRPLSGEAEGSNWTVERGPGEAIQEDENGRVSPTKSSSDERTSSTLSERSTRTTTSDTSITRTMSTRTGAILAAAAAAYRANITQAGPSPTEDRTRTISSNGGRKSPYYFARGRSPTAGSMTPGAPNSMIEDAESFTTARSNFMELQSEGEALLGGRPALDRDDPYQRAFAAQNPARPPPHTLPSLGSMQQRRRPGLMGSLRRAINAVSTVGERSFSLTSSADPYRHEPQNSSSSSPIKDRGQQIGSAPRRAVSDGGALLKQKRGQKDWEDDKVFPPYHDDPDPNDWGEPRSSLERKRAEDEWDVEGEATRRDVQIMFTIPKSRLRVVNDDMDRASLRSASDGAVSRHNSVKDLGREESLKTSRARSEGDKALLPPTQEEEAEKEKAA